jgi:hypothetical protein
MPYEDIDDKAVDIYFSAPWVKEYDNVYLGSFKEGEGSSVWYLGIHLHDCLHLSPRRELSKQPRAENYLDPVGFEKLKDCIGIMDKKGCFRFENYNNAVKVAEEVSSIFNNTWLKKNIDKQEEKQ